MKKLFVSSAVALALSSSVVVAEESGAFVGVGLGYGGAKYTIDLSGPGASKDSLSGSGMRYELIAGYKQFFTDSFGLRYYGSFIYGDNTFKQGGANVKSTLMSYSANVDALYNFVNSGDMDFGAFLGLGVGANTWGGKLMDEAKEYAADIGKLSTTGVDVALNVGLRGVFAKQHGVELAARVPFMATTLISKGDDTNTLKATIKPNYNVGVRYTFSF